MTEQDSTPLNGQQKKRKRSTGTLVLSVGSISVACMIAVSTPVLNIRPAYQDLSMVLGILGMGLGLGATLVAMRELRRISMSVKPHHACRRKARKKKRPSLQAGGSQFGIGSK